MPDPRPPIPTPKLTYRGGATFQRLYGAMRKKSESERKILGPVADRLNDFARTQLKFLLFFFLAMFLFLKFMGTGLPSWVLLGAGAILAIPIFGVKTRIHAPALVVVGGLGMVVGILLAVEFVFHVPVRAWMNRAFEFQTDHTKKCR